MAVPAEGGAGPCRASYLPPLHRDLGATSCIGARGKLDFAGHRADWEAKLNRYARHGILPWKDDGGPAGALVWSTERIKGQASTHPMRNLM
jgi:hypothetical protein